MAWKQFPLYWVLYYFFRCYDIDMYVNLLIDSSQEPLPKRSVSNSMFTISNTSWWSIDSLNDEYQIYFTNVSLTAMDVIPVVWSFCMHMTIIAATHAQHYVNSLAPGVVVGISKVVFPHRRCGLSASTLFVKLLSSKCHSTYLILSQHWLRE